MDESSNVVREYAVEVTGAERATGAFQDAVEDEQQERSEDVSVNCSKSVMYNIVSSDDDETTALTLDANQTTCTITEMNREKITKKLVELEDEEGLQEGINLVSESAAHVDFSRDRGTKDSTAVMEMLQAKHDMVIVEESEEEKVLEEGEKKGKDQGDAVIMGVSSDAEPPGTEENDKLRRNDENDDDLVLIESVDTEDDAEKTMERGEEYKKGEDKMERVENGDGYMSKGELEGFFLVDSVGEYADEGMTVEKRKKMEETGDFIPLESTASENKIKNMAGQKYKMRTGEQAAREESKEVKLEEARKGVTAQEMEDVIMIRDSEPESDVEEDPVVGVGDAEFMVFNVPDVKTVVSELSELVLKRRLVVYPVHMEEMSHPTLLDAISKCTEFKVSWVLWTRSNPGDTTTAIEMSGEEERGVTGPGGGPVIVGQGTHWLGLVELYFKSSVGVSETLNSLRKIRTDLTVRHLAANENIARTLKFWRLGIKPSARQTECLLYVKFLRTFKNKLSADAAISVGAVAIGAPATVGAVAATVLTKGATYQEATAHDAIHSTVEKSNTEAAGASSTPIAAVTTSAAVVNCAATSTDQAAAADNEPDSVARSAIQSEAVGLSSSTDPTAATSFSPPADQISDTVGEGMDPANIVGGCKKSDPGGTENHLTENADRGNKAMENVVAESSNVNGVERGVGVEGLVVGKEEIGIEHLQKIFDKAVDILITKDNKRHHAWILYEDPESAQSAYDMYTKNLSLLVVNNNVRLHVVKYSPPRVRPNGLMKLQRRFRLFSQIDILKRATANSKVRFSPAVMNEINKTVKKCLMALETDNEARKLIGFPSPSFKELCRYPSLRSSLINSMPLWDPTTEENQRQTATAGVSNQRAMAYDRSVNEGNTQRQGGHTMQQQQPQEDSKNNEPGVLLKKKLNNRLRSVRSKQRKAVLRQQMIRDGGFMNNTALTRPFNHGGAEGGRGGWKGTGVGREFRLSSLASSVAEVRPVIFKTSRKGRGGLATGAPGGGGWRGELGGGMGGLRNSATGRSSTWASGNQVSHAIRRGVKRNWTEDISCSGVFSTDGAGPPYKVAIPNKMAATNKVAVPNKMAANKSDGSDMVWLPAPSNTVNKSPGSSSSFPAPSSMVSWATIRSTAAALSNAVNSISPMNKSPGGSRFPATSDMGAMNNSAGGSSIPTSLTPTLIPGQGGRKRKNKNKRTTGRMQQQTVPSSATVNRNQGRFTSPQPVGRDTTYAQYYNQSGGYDNQKAAFSNQKAAFSNQKGAFNQGGGGGSSSGYNNRGNTTQELMSPKWSGDVYNIQRYNSRQGNSDHTPLYESNQCGWANSTQHGGVGLGGMGGGNRQSEELARILQLAHGNPTTPSHQQQQSYWSGGQNSWSSQNQTTSNRSSGFRRTSGNSYTWPQL